MGLTHLASPRAQWSRLQEPGLQGSQEAARAQGPVHVRANEGAARLGLGLSGATSASWEPPSPRAC